MTAYELAEAEIGTIEWKDGNNPKVVAYFKDAGHHGTNFLRNTGGGGSGSGNIRIETSGVTEVYAQEARAHLNGTPRVADETRPRNVALLYCIKV